MTPLKHSHYVHLHYKYVVYYGIPTIYALSKIAVRGIRKIAFIYFFLIFRPIARAGTTMNDTNVVDVFTHSRLCGCAIRTRWDVHNLFQLSMTYSVFQLIHLRAANLWFLLICSAIIIIRLFAHILWCLLAQLIRMCVCVSVWLGAELNFDLVEWIHVNCQ